VRIGSSVRSYSSMEREAYCKLLVAWQGKKIFEHSELKALKKAWDAD